MSKSKTRLQHTYATEAPFECMTGDLSDQGFLVVVDKSTHELVVRYGAEEGTITVLVNPKGVEVQGVSPRPGTRMGDTTSYAAHDAALKALDKQKYRALLEATLASHIGQEPAAAADDPEHAPYLRGEINGLCMALRLLGGYEGFGFDGEWARTIPPASFAWRRFLGYPDGGTSAEAVTVTIPVAEKARRYRLRLVDLLEKAEAAVRPGAGKRELAALADEAHTLRTQLDVEEWDESRRQAAASHSGAIEAPRGHSL